MISEDRLMRALHDVADGVAAPEVDLSAVRRGARARRTRAVSAAAVTTAVAMIVAGTTLLGGGDSSVLLPASRPLPSTTTSATTQDAYTSAQYGFTIVPPPGWHYEPADRAWVWESDVRALEGGSQAHETFSSPEGDVNVSAWAAPVDPGSAPETRAALETWVEDYCLSSGESPCTGIADRAVELCEEGSDCSVGVLVRFSVATYAFFTGGSFGNDTVTVVMVGRPESDVSVVPYGGARKLLLRFLAPMGVWPSPSG